MTTKGKSPRPLVVEEDFDVATSVTNDEYGAPEEDGVNIVMAGPGRALFLPIAVKRLTPDKLEVLADLQHIVLERQKLLGDMEEVVLAARSMGLSWNVIGWSTGMTGQAARKRWMELEDPS